MGTRIHAFQGAGHTRTKMSIWVTGGHMMLLCSLLMLVLATRATSATSEDSALVQQDEGTNKQQPLKYTTYSQYLPFQAAHPPLVYQMPGMPLPLSYQLPVQQVPSAANPPARTPASTVLLQRLMHAPTTVQVPSLPNYVTFDNEALFAMAAEVESRTGCLGLLSKCINVPIRYQSIMMESALPGLPFTYARNPVLQPILLEEDLETDHTYGPIFFCLMFVLKHSTDVACLASLPASLLPIVCSIVSGIVPGLPFC